MAPDDFERRRQESIDHLNRQQDRLDFEAGQARQSKAVSDAISQKNLARAYQELGIPPPRPHDTGDPAAVEPAHPSAQAQFVEHAAKLITTLEGSRFLPSHIGQEWLRQIKAIRNSPPATGLAIVDALREEHAMFDELYRPRPHLFNLRVTDIEQFGHEMHSMEHELDWLKRIIEHVAALRKQGPG